MHCPFCHYSDSRVIDTRSSDDGTIVRRRRECPECHKRFTTTETASLTVVKRSGNMEPFSREKIISGVGKSCQGRPVSDDQLKLLAQQVEESIRMSGTALVESSEIGHAILAPLRELDKIAYLRFASVYSNFDTLDEFAQAIDELRSDADGAGTEEQTSDA